MSVWACTVLMYCVNGALLADEPALWRGLFGPGNVTAVTGNGGLTVGLDACGRVVACRWPSPGYFDQVSYDGSADGAALSPQGLQWGVVVDDEIHWLSGEDWVSQRSFGFAGAPSVITQSQNARLGLRVKQTLWVHSDKDIMVWQIGVQGSTGPPRLCFFADLTPCTRLLPQVPLADWALDDLNDFAAYVEPDANRVWHFRPRQPGTRDWQRARSIRDGSTPSREWDRFGDGVWAVYGSTGRVSGAMCFETESMPVSHRTIAAEAAGAGNPSCVGQCMSLLWLEPEDVAEVWRGTVFIAFGASRADAASALSYAIETGDVQLARESDMQWVERLNATRMAPETHPQFARRLRDAVTSVLVAMDRNSGAIVRAPLTEPPYALDWPRYGIWTTLALDLAGFHADAERHLAFYLNALRDGSRTTAPAGSLPAALYANGEDALPAVLLERDASGFLLGALWRHGILLDEAARASFFRTVWPRAETCAEFLAAWTLDSGGRVLDSYQPGRSSDGSSVESLLTAYAGLESAIRIAESIEESVSPAVRRGSQDIQSVLQLQFYTMDAPWKWPLGLAFWMDAIVPEGHWLRKPLRTSTASWTPLSTEAAESLAGFLGQDLTFPSPDALQAALEIIVALH